MSGRGRFHRGNRNKNQQTLSSVARETAASLAPDSPVLAMFRSAAIKLNDRQDRHERLVKLSRDITMESKRIIFLLHSAITEEATKKAVEDANERLQKLISGPLKSIGLELENSPAYLHTRAVTAGFQEFIEARTLCSLMEKKVIIPYKEVQTELSYNVKEEIDGNEIERSVITKMPQTDYMLGIADLTGELMRRAINTIASGDSAECIYVCQVVRELYTGYLGLFGMGKELGRKMNVTRANVAKVEAAVYALHVRGGEAPSTLIVPPPALQQDWENNHLSDDEGYY
ncbi:translin-associated protein X [Galleria mellonella]|uniref:Translin-associated protein X n=1 Tax=Galleria mellonella TaxID=7137 RepID=A0A6J1X813_GALME|nr:translin-associated protein X [Galleria mellonella]